MGHWASKGTTLYGILCLPRVSKMKGNGRGEQQLCGQQCAARRGGAELLLQPWEVGRKEHVPETEEEPRGRRGRFPQGSWPSSHCMPPHPFFELRFVLRPFRLKR